MNKDIYIHKQGRYFSVAILFFAFCAFAFPIYAFFFLQNSVFLFLSPIAALFFVPSQSFEVDYKNKRCRDCSRFLQYSWGEWEDISNAIHISIKIQYMKLEYEKNSNKIGNYTLYFYSQNRRKVEIDEFSDYDKALDIAFEIANGLNIKVWDATSKPGRYIIN